MWLPWERARARRILNYCTRENLAAVHRVTQVVAGGIRKVMDPLGMAVLQLNGQGVGQLVMHYHVHLIPRPHGAPELVVSHMGAQSGDHALLAQTAEEIVAAIK